MIILDTDALIEILQKGSKKGDQIFRILKNSHEEIATTSLNLHEIVYGLIKNQSLNIMAELAGFRAIGFTKSDAMLSAKMEFELERKGMKTARLDCMIAAIAINKGAKLCTLNTKHFKRFEKFGLKLLKISQ